MSVVLTLSRAVKVPLMAALFTSKVMPDGIFSELVADALYFDTGAPSATQLGFLSIDTNAAPASHHNGANGSVSLVIAASPSYRHRLIVAPPASAERSV